VPDQQVLMQLDQVLIHENTYHLQQMLSPGWCPLSEGTSHMLWQNILTFNLLASKALFLTLYTHTICIDTYNEIHRSKKMTSGSSLPSTDCYISNSGWHNTCTCCKYFKTK
jgi:hypothetical protein